MIVGAEWGSGRELAVLVAAGAMVMRYILISIVAIWSLKATRLRACMPARWAARPEEGVAAADAFRDEFLGADRQLRLLQP